MDTPEFENGRFYLKHIGAERDISISSNHISGSTITIFDTVFDIAKYRILICLVLTVGDQLLFP